MEFQEFFKLSKENTVQDMERILQQKKEEFQDVDYYFHICTCADGILKLYPAYQDVVMNFIVENEFQDRHDDYYIMLTEEDSDDPYAVGLEQIKENLQNSFSYSHLARMHEKGSIVFPFNQEGIEKFKEHFLGEKLWKLYFKNKLENNLPNKEVSKKMKV